jgi:hypothetical protein
MKVKAKESHHIEKVRKKLQEQLDSDNKKVTPAALEKMSTTIKGWISRHAEERIDLKNKEVVALFDSNKHSATTKSRFVSKLLEHLQSSPKLPALEKGRVTSEQSPGGAYKRDRGTVAEG